MLFTSYAFVFAFLPVSLAGFFIAARLGRGIAAWWLVLASFFFYGWWNPHYLPLLAISIAFNFSCAELIGAKKKRPEQQNWILAFAVAANILALIYYKYLFATTQFLFAHGVINSPVSEIILPLGISFFTFTQIGYLVDVKQNVAKSKGLLNYLLFVTFFPHLIAGPILHNREMMPQFSDKDVYRFSALNFSAGLTVFFIGMFKKCVLADPNSLIVADAFSNTEHIPFFLAWNGALSYSLQLYFDFSGYSDMAIGIARMFNVKFPLNFNSPYKAASIIDFWHRWHMTLTRYLTLLLYYPIAWWITRRRMAKGLDVSTQSAKTPSGFISRLVVPTFITIVLAGIWHGAGFQFLIFGILHASYLSINHAWRTFGPQKTRPTHATLSHIGNVLLTYLAVLVAQVFFRAPSVDTALGMLSGMIGLHGLGTAISLPDSINSHLGIFSSLFASTGGLSARQALAIPLLFTIVWAFPNTQQIMRNYSPVIDKVQQGVLPWLTWHPSLRWAMACGAIATLALTAMGGTSEFLYFRF